MSTSSSRSAKRKASPPPGGGSAKKSPKTSTSTSTATEQDNFASDFANIGAYGFGSGGRSSRDAKDAAPLSWRLDEVDSLSDWTIVVTRAHFARTYHVHKIMLAVGPKRSEYFASLFKGQNQLAELDDATSRIELEDSAADAFPVMLDYLYCTDTNDCEFGAANITVENAVALRHLAQYFQISKLFEIATDRLQSDMCPDNSPIFILEATIYGDARLANAAIGVCAEKIGEIDAEHFKELPPNIFVKILSSGKLSAKYSKALSHIVAHYCEAHMDEDEIDEEMLLTMTNETIMPQVDKVAALPLLKILTELSSDSKAKAGTEKLRARCMETISASWVDVADAKAKKPTGKGVKQKYPRFKKGKADGSDLPDDLQVELLGACLQTAKKDLGKETKEKDELCRTLEGERRVIADLREQISSATRRVQKYKTRLFRCNPYSQFSSDDE